MSRWIEAAEVPMLVAAAAAVAIYLVDLAGLWDAWTLVRAADGAALLIDLLFVGDLVAKLVVQRARYLKTPWFVIDLLCTLPVLSTLTLAPGLLQGLRLMRILRVLRALRMLRLLRTLRILRLLSEDGRDSPEQRHWHRALTISVILYAVVFVGLVAWARSDAPRGRVIAIDGQPVGEVVVLELERRDGTVVRRELPAEVAFARPDRAELNLVLGAILSLVLVVVVARFQVPAMFSRQLRALLNVALPEQVAEWMLQNPEQYDRTVRMPATVIFTDIKGFTASVENLELDDLKRHLERALEAVVQAHRSHDLIIDKFIGDAVMSFRGGDIAGGPPDEIAWRVVRAALDGQAALRQLDDPYFRDVKIGGASSDAALIGAFGTSSRLSYTVMGDKVNLAARLEAACNELGVTNLFDDETHRLTQHCDDIAWRRVGMVRVQGRVGVATAWQAFDPGNTAWLARYHAALEAVEERRFDEAIAGFVAVLEEQPGDGPSVRWLESCRAWVSGVDASWQPVLETRK